MICIVRKRLGICDGIKAVLKTWCQEHRIPVSTMNYWLRKLKTLDEQSDTDMIFAKMPTEKEISTNETLNTSLSPVRIFITNSIRIEVMPECHRNFFVF